MLKYVWQLQSQISVDFDLELSHSSKLAGMILQFGQPNLHTHLLLCKNGKKILQVFNAYNKEFDNLVHCFPAVPLGDEDITAIGKLCMFLDVCHAFIHSLLGWKSSDEGLFGKVDTYLENITYNEVEGFKFQVLIWVNQPDYLVSPSLDTNTLIRRGGVSEAAHSSFQYLVQWFFTLNLHGTLDQPTNLFQTTVFGHGSLPVILRTAGANSNLLQLFF